MPHSLQKSFFFLEGTLSQPTLLRWFRILKRDNLPKYHQGAQTSFLLSSKGIPFTPACRDP